MYQASTVPASADYAVEADVHVASMMPGDEAVLKARVSDAGTSYYQWYYETFPTGAQWTLLRVKDGVTFQVLGTFSQTLTPGETHRARLEVQGSAIRGYVDGVLRASGTDTAVTAAGRAGIGLGWDPARSINDDSDGLHLDDFRVVDASPPAGPARQPRHGGRHLVRDTRDRRRCARGRPRPRGPPHADSGPRDRPSSGRRRLHPRLLVPERGGERPRGQLLQRGRPGAGLGG